MLEELNICGRLDVRCDGSRATSWVGRPTGNDHKITIVIEPLTEENRYA